MGFFDALTGKAQRGRIEEAYGRSNQLMGDAYGKA